MYNFIMLLSAGIILGSSESQAGFNENSPEYLKKVIAKTEKFKKIGDDFLVLDLYYPPGWTADAEKLPAIVFFFGGGWKRGNKLLLKDQSRDLAARGMIAVCAQYRTQASHKTEPDVCLRDAKSAMRYVRGNASRLGIDASKIAAGGSSAGGHLAAATAFCPGFNEPGDDLTVSCCPDALVLLNPVIDTGPNGYGYRRVNKYWHNFSPVHNISANPPPVLFMVGDSDRVVPVAMAKKFKDELEKHGGSCELHIYPGQKHGFYTKSKKNGYYAITINAIDEFLVKNNFLKPGKR